MTITLLILYIVTPILTVINLTLTVGLCWSHWNAAQEPETRNHVLLILCMVPLYGLMAALCVVWPQHYLYFELVRQSYEALVLWRFFQLLLHYLRRHSHQVLGAIDASFAHNQKCLINHDYANELTEKTFLALESQSLLWCCQINPSLGLFKLLRYAVLQYCTLRLVLPPIQVTLYLLGLYSNRQPEGGYLWITLLCTISLSITLFALWLLIRLTRPVIWRYGPTTKLLAIKLVIFFIFWQSVLFSVATYFEAIPLIAPGWSPELTTEVLHSALICFELAWLALYHYWIFASDEHQMTSIISLQAISYNDLHTSTS